MGGAVPGRIWQQLAPILIRHGLVVPDEMGQVRDHMFSASLSVVSPEALVVRRQALREDAGWLAALQRLGAAYYQDSAPWVSVCICTRRRPAPPELPRR